MTKTDLINRISDVAALSKVDSRKALEATLDAITDALRDGDKVAILGFGTFSVAERPERQGVNPSTREPITIPARKVVKFKAGVELESEIQ